MTTLQSDQEIGDEMLKLPNSMVLGISAVIGADASPPVSRAPDKIVKIDGSSTVFPITEAVAEDFQKAIKGAVKVTVGISGTGGGFKKFCRGEIDIVDASRPILKKEMADCKAAAVQYVEMPVAFDALTVVVNPKNNWSNVITVAELKKMWEPAAQAKVTTMESGESCLARRTNQTLRCWRGLGHFRLFYRGHCRQG